MTRCGQCKHNGGMTEQHQRGTVPDWTLGWRMQRALAHGEISVEGMAAVLGVSRSTISRWLNDRGAPPRTIYVREWALRCGVDYGWLSGNPRYPASVSSLSGDKTCSVKRPAARHLGLAA